MILSKNQWLKKPGKKAANGMARKAPYRHLAPKTEKIKRSEP
jgi:hypothetical protein